MRKTAAIGAIAMLAAFGAQTASATGFSYNLIEGSLISGDDYDGFGVAGQMEFTSEFFGLGAIDALDIDGGGDGSMLTLGAGYSRAINDRLDLFATGSLERYKVDGAGSEMGFGLGVGLRGKLMPQLELHGGLKYTDVGDFDSDTTLHIGGRWYFNSAFAAGLDLQDNDFGSTLRFTARYDFGNRM